MLQVAHTIRAIIRSYSTEQELSFTYAIHNNPNLLTQTSLQTTNMIRFKKFVHVRIRQRHMEQFQP